MSKLERPECYSDKMKQYLIDLRELGTVNMLRVGPLLGARYGLDRREQRDVVLYWMETGPNG